MAEKLTLNSEVFAEATAKANEVIQQTMEKLETGNFEKAHILFTLDIRPTYNDGDSMLIDVDHKVNCTMKQEIKTEKGTTNSDNPITKVDDVYVAGENPQMSLDMNGGTNDEGDSK